MPFLSITSGSGRTAWQLIEELLTHPDCPDLRVLVRSGGARPLEQAFPILAQAPHSIATVDYMDERTLTAVFQNTAMVIHNGPSVHQQEAAMAMSVIDAAKSAGVRHFVLCSVLHPVRTKLIPHKLKLATEEYLIESRLNYTIVQPTDYMQNVSLRSVLRTGKLPLGYSPSVVQGFLDLRDFCRVLRRIILNPENHNLATYQLVSENKSYTEVATLLQELMGREVECEVIPLKRYIEIMKEGRVVQSEYAEDAMERIMIYHDRWGLTGNSNILELLLGCEPTTWRQYAAEILRET